MTKLPIIQRKCFDVHEENSILCKKKQCQQWIPDEQSCNCVIISARQGPKTFQEIADIYGVSRMRICQQQKEIYNKIRTVIEMQETIR